MRRQRVAGRRLPPPDWVPLQRRLGQAHRQSDSSAARASTRFTLATTEQALTAGSHAVPRWLPRSRERSERGRRIVAGSEAHTVDGRPGSSCSSRGRGATTDGLVSSSCGELKRTGDSPAHDAAVRIGLHGPARPDERRPGEIRRRTISSVLLPGRRGDQRRACTSGAADPVGTRRCVRHTARIRARRLRAGSEVSSHPPSVGLRSAATTGRFAAADTPDCPRRARAYALRPSSAAAGRHVRPPSEADGSLVLTAEPRPASLVRPLQRLSSGERRPWWWRITATHGSFSTTTV